MIWNSRPHEYQSYSVLLLIHATYWICICHIGSVYIQLQVASMITYRTITCLIQCNHIGLSLLVLWVCRSHRDICSAQGIYLTLLLFINTSTCFLVYALRYAPPMSMVMTCLRSLAAIVAMMNSPTSDIVVGNYVSFSVYKYLFCLCPPPTIHTLSLLNNPFEKHFGLTNVLDGIRALSCFGVKRLGSWNLNTINLISYCSSLITACFAGSPNRSMASEIVKLFFCLIVNIACHITFLNLLLRWTILTHLLPSL